MTTDITELAQSHELRNKVNHRLYGALEFQGTSGENATITLSIDECKSIIAALDERIALVEALEKAQETIAFQQGEIKALLSSLESRTVTVKLPKRSVGEVMHMSGFSRDYAEGWCAGNDNAIHEMRVAGIKVEAE